MNFTLLVTVLLTAVTLVAGAYVVARLIGPRSSNPVKGDARRLLPFCHPFPDV